MKGLFAVQEGPLALTLCEVGAVEGFRAEEWRDLTWVLQASSRKEVEMLISSDSERQKIRGVKAKAFCQPRLELLITASQTELL